MTAERLRGRTVRVVTVSPSEAQESFWPDLGDGYGSWDSADVVGQFDVVGPSGGPLLLWDEVVGAVADVDAVRGALFDGNQDVWAPEVPTGRPT